ncbi:MAG: ComEA family DNA-binding protein [Gammaproteobacteria bacterium]
MKYLIFILAFFSINVIAAPVNINTADAQTLSASLKGIGQKKAEAIIQYRKEKGGFKSVEELASVTGIGPKTIEINKGDILLKDPGKN